MALAPGCSHLHPNITKLNIECSHVTRGYYYHDDVITLRKMTSYTMATFSNLLKGYIKICPYEIIIGLLLLLCERNKINMRINKIYFTANMKIHVSNMMHDK